MNLNISIKKTRKREFLEQMEQVVPLSDLVALIAPYYPEGKTGRPPFSLMSMLRIHFMQQWESALSRPEEKHGAALHPVCAVQFVDGAQQIDGGWGMSAPENMASALKKAKNTKTAPPKRRSFRIFLVKFRHPKINLLLHRFALSCSDHP